MAYISESFSFKLQSLEETEPEPVSGEVDMDGAHLIVSWSCLITLLSICKHPGCGDQVLPDNMDITRNGNLVFDSLFSIDIL